MHHHLQLCELALASIDDEDWEEESDIDDNSKDVHTRAGFPCQSLAIQLVPPLIPKCSGTYYPLSKITVQYCKLYSIYVVPGIYLSNKMVLKC